MKRTVFPGGPPGGAVNIVIDNGANQAAADLGADLGAAVSPICSDRNFEPGATRLRDLIARRPDGIARMRHPGDDALMPLAEPAAEAGIPIIHVNVDVPEVRARFGSGDIGADLCRFGSAVGQEAPRRAGDRVKAGDQAVVMIRWESADRSLRGQGTADLREQAGREAIRLQKADGASSDTMPQLPSLTAAVLSNPGVRIPCCTGAQHPTVVPADRQAMGKQPGDIIGVGVDLGPGVTSAIAQGYAPVTGDQQPRLQG